MNATYVLDDYYMDIAVCKCNDTDEWDWSNDKCVFNETETGSECNYDEYLMKATGNCVTYDDCTNM